MARRRFGVMLRISTLQVDAVLATSAPAKVHPADVATPQIKFESALALGDVWALGQLWRELYFDSLAGVFRRTRIPTR